MAEFKQLIITNKGQALMAKMIAGAGNIKFTKISVSDTTYSDSQLTGLTALSGIKQSTLISKVIRTNNVAVQVEGAVTNTELTSGYYMRTIGLYAIDPDLGEILYAVTIASQAGYMPPYNGITTSGAFFKLVTTVSNASSVSLNVDPAAVATIGDIQDLQNKISDLQAFVGYTDNDIMGVEVDFASKKFTRLAGAMNRTPGAMFDNIKAFGGRRRCNLTDDGKVLAYYGNTGYSETGVLTQEITIGEDESAVTYAVGTKVQVMVEQPKFYYKVVPLELEPIQGGNGFHMRKARYYVSDTQKTGFKLHAAFISNGVEKSHIYLSAYEGSLFDVSSNSYILDDAQVADFATDMLCSIANAKPISGSSQNLNRSNIRKLAQKRGAGWEQSYMATIAVSQLLALIEYAAFDVQSFIGLGQVSKSYINDKEEVNNAEITGATANLGNKSGSVTNVNGINIVSYRGEENFWGNIWKWIDGINIKNPNTFTEESLGKIYIADHSFSDDNAESPYKDSEICSVFGEGYVSAFGYSEKFDWLFIPTKSSGNNYIPVGDYHWNKNPNWRGALLGGGWGEGRNAGAFYWTFRNRADDHYRRIGGRLVYVPQTV